MGAKYFNLHLRCQDPDMVGTQLLRAGVPCGYLTVSGPGWVSAAPYMTGSNEKQVCKWLSQNFEEPILSTENYDEEVFYAGLYAAGEQLAAYAVDPSGQYSGPNDTFGGVGKLRPLLREDVNDFDLQRLLTKGLMSEAALLEAWVRRVQSDERADGNPVSTREEIVKLALERGDHTYVLQEDSAFTSSITHLSIMLGGLLGIENGAMLASYIYVRNNPSEFPGLDWQHVGEPTTAMW